MEGNSHMNTNGEEQEVKKKKIIAVYNTHNSPARQQNQPQNRQQHRQSLPQHRRRLRRPGQ